MELIINTDKKVSRRKDIGLLKKKIEGWAEKKYWDEDPTNLSFWKKKESKSTGVIPGYIFVKYIIVADESEDNFFDDDNPFKLIINILDYTVTVSSTTSSTSQKDKYITKPGEILSLLNQLSIMQRREEYLLEMIRDAILVAVEQVESTLITMEKHKNGIDGQGLVFDVLLSVAMGAGAEAVVAFSLAAVIGKLIKSRHFLKVAASHNLSGDGKVYQDFSKALFSRTNTNSREGEAFQKMLINEDGISLLSEDASAFVKETISLTSKVILGIGKKSAGGKGASSSPYAEDPIVNIVKKIFDSTREQKYFNNCLYDSLRNKMTTGLFTEAHLIEFNKILEDIKLPPSVDLSNRLRSDFELIMWHALYPIQDPVNGLVNTDVKYIKFKGLDVTLSVFLTEYLMRRTPISARNLNIYYNYNFNSEYYLGQYEHTTQEKYKEARELELKQIDEIKFPPKDKHNLYIKKTSADINKMKIQYKTKIEENFKHSKDMWSNRELKPDTMISLRMIAFGRRYEELGSHLDHHLLRLYKGKVTKEITLK